MQKTACRVKVPVNNLYVVGRSRLSTTHQICPMDSDSTMRVLIVDDERLARQRLEDLLEREDEIVVVGSVNTGAKAIDAIREKVPDLVFLDVQMPGLSGLDVVEELGVDRMPLVIFVTAYDQYALKAFELAALDYLLKPFENERFKQALDRAREASTLRELSDFRERLAALLDNPSVPSGTSESKKRYLERIAVEKRGQVRVVPVDSIDFFSAEGSYVEVHTGDQTHLIRERMQTLEERLAPNEFFRIHRSYIVRLDRIESLIVGGGGDYAVKLTDGKRLKVSRSRREELEERLGLNA